MGLLHQKQIFWQAAVMLELPETYRVKPSFMLISEILNWSYQEKKKNIHTMSP